MAARNFKRSIFEKFAIFCRHARRIANAALGGYTRLVVRSGPLLMHQ